MIRWLLEELNKTNRVAQSYRQSNQYGNTVLQRLPVIIPFCGSSFGSFSFSQ